MKTSAQNRKALLEVAKALRECAKENRAIGQQKEANNQILRAVGIEKLVSLSEEMDAKLANELQRNTFG